MQALVRLLFTSRFVAKPDDSLLHELSLTSGRNNSRDEITGTALLSPVQNIVALEGSRRDVSACYNRIVQNESHKDVLLLLCAPIHRRSFHDWTSRLLSVSPSAQVRLDSIITELDVVDPAAHELALGLLHQLSARCTVIPTPRLPS